MIEKISNFILGTYSTIIFLMFSGRIMIKFEEFNIVNLIFIIWFIIAYLLTKGGDLKSE